MRPILDSGRLCSRCGEVKPPDAFHRQPKMRDGLMSWCKPCNVAATRVWRAANRAAFNAAARARRARDREAVNARKRAIYAQRKEIR